MKRICIVGGSAAGLSAIRRLQDGLGGRRNVQVVFVHDGTHVDYLPLLPDVATGSVTSRSGRIRLENVLSGKVKVVQDRIVGISKHRREVTGERQTYPYDVLIIATGPEPDDGGAPHARRMALPYMTIPDATRLSRRIVAAFTQNADARDPMRTFVIAGGGARGVELAAAFAAAARTHLLPRSSGGYKLFLVEPHDEVLPRFSPVLRQQAQSTLDRLGVHVLTGDRVIGFDNDIVALEQGESLRSAHLIWAAGVAPPLWLARSEMPVSPDGRLLVGDDLAVREQNGIFAIGDAAVRSSGDPWPATALTAVQQGPRAAENLLLYLVGASHHPFRPLFGLECIRLGHDDGAIDFGNFLWSGAAAGGAVRLLHAMTAPTITKKLAILGEWAGELAGNQDWARLPMMDRRSRRQVTW